MGQERTGKFAVIAIGAARLALVGICLSFLGFVSGEARADRHVHYLRDDATGGDCGLIGTWDEATLTCTLTGDTDGIIVIDSDGVTLDGAGYLMNGTNAGTSESDGAGDAVSVIGRQGVTVRDLTVRRYDYGVNLEYSSGCTITGIHAIENAHAAISLTDADGNMITANRITNNGIDTGICVGFDSDANAITGNVISGAQRGIFIHTFCGANEVSGNNLSGNGWAITLFDQDSGNRLSGNRVSGNGYGIYLLGRSHDNAISDNEINGNNVGALLKSADNNTFFGNSFVGNQVQAESGNSWNNRFSLAVPAGGNYWDDFDTPDEGCRDNGAGFCDAPYRFDDGSDELPRMTPARELCGRPQLGLAGVETYWASYDDYRERYLTVGLELTNTGGSDAYGVTITRAGGSGGTSPASDLPSADVIARGAAASLTLRYFVPPGVDRFKVTLQVAAFDTCGFRWNYPG